MTLSTLAIVALAISNLAFARGGEFSSLGGVVGDDSPEALAINDRVFARLAQDYRGVVSWSGVVYTGATVTFPTEGNFGLSGDGATSRLVCRGGDYAVRIASGAAARITYRKVLAGLAIEGEGGVEITAGGKFVAARDLVLTGRSQPGLSAKNTDGMAWDNVYCFGGGAAGASFEACYHNQFFRFTCRNNAGPGLVVRNCAAWSGSLYLENNKGTGGDFEGLKRSRLDVWLEANGGETGNKQPQAARRDCLHNIWTGQTHDDQRWIDDPISALLNRTLTSPHCSSLTAHGSFWPDIGELIGKDLTMAPKGFDPALVSVDQNTLVVKLDGFATPNTPSRNIEFKGIDPAAGWDAGDYFQVDCDVSADTAALEWFSEQKLPMIRFVFLGGSGIDVAENVFPTGKYHLRAIGRATKAGTAPRLFGLIFPVAGPDRELRLTFSSVSVRRLVNR